MRLGRCMFHPWVRKISRGRKWQPIPVFLLGKAHRERSRPWGHRDTTEQLNTTRQFCARSLGRVWLLVTAWTAARQAPLSMGLSWQEHWSGSPFPSPGDLPNPGIEPRSPALQAGSLPSEPPGKPKNTGAGSLSLLQGTFPTQESNWGLLRCRWILYQPSHMTTFSPNSLPIQADTWHWAEFTCYTVGPC